MLAASKKPAMVAVMLANNETGVVQPVARVAEVARRHGALVHCDGAQAAGKIAVDIKALGVHSLALSAHKLGGPAGVGALVLTGEREVTPLWRGGGQERGRRAGTENVAGIAGFGAAASTSLDAMVALAVWRDQVERSLREVAPALQVFGMTAERLPNTTCLTMPGVSSEIQVMAFDLAGISVSAGAACSSGKVASSHVLRAMGVDDADAECAIRISLGWNSRKDDIDRLVEAWSALYARLGRRAPASATAA
jgi:cysteine desulfurase